MDYKMRKNAYWNHIIEFQKCLSEKHFFKKQVQAHINFYGKKNKGLMNFKINKSRMNEWMKLNKIEIKLNINRIKIICLKGFKLESHNFETF